MTDNPIFQNLFPDYHDVFPVIALIDETACHADIARAKESWWTHGEKPLEQMSEYMRHALNSRLDFNDDEKPWIDMSFNFVEFANERIARQSYVQASLSADCVRGVLRFTQQDQTEVANYFCRMDRLILLNEALETCEGAIINYTDVRRDTSPSGQELPQFPGFYLLKEEVKAEIELFETGVRDLINNLKLCGD